jgi:hypothetical protein
MAYDTTANRLWMSDSSNNRVLAFNFIALPSITTTGTVGTAYSSTASTTGAQGTVTYALASGSVPAGLTFNPSTGAITGTPTTAATSNFTVNATDTLGTFGLFTDSKSYSITISAASTPPITPTPTPTQTSSLGVSSGSVSTSVLASLLAPSAATTAYLNSRGNASPTVPIISSIFNRDLSLGMNGSDIKLLQQYLNTHGYPIASSGPGSSSYETTRFGALTKAALIKFQKAHSIAGTGYFGPITRAFVNGK